MTPPIRTRRVLIVFLFLASGCGVYFATRYPGLVGIGVSQFRYATWHENQNLFRTVRYWVRWVDRLRISEKTGLWSLDGFDEEPLNDFEKGQLAYHRGQFPEAVGLLKTHIEQRGESQSALFWLALSYMREAEAQNCLAHLIDLPAGGGPADLHSSSGRAPMCSLPLKSFHSREQGARAAAEILQKLLDEYDPSNRLYQWLLNFNYMTVHGYPQDVPPDYRIQSDFTDFFYGERGHKILAQYSHLSFQDQARQLNVATFNAGKGVAVEDFDNDGYLDIVTGGTFDPLKFYKNLSGSTFSDRTKESGLSGATQAHIITAADYNNDGWMDLLVGRPFWHFVLYANNGDGTFQDVTSSSGLLDHVAAEEVTPTWAAPWADIDNDGDLDLFVASWGMNLPLTAGLLAKPNMDSRLFVNEGGHFADRTKQFGLARLVRDREFTGAAFGDYDSDGYPDLFLSSIVANRSVLLKNISGRRFEPAEVLPRTLPGFMAAFVDLNHDGRLDIFQGGFSDVFTSTEQVVFGENVNRYSAGRSVVLLQNAAGRFERREDAFQDEMPASTMGASFGDLDNDGCNDFYLGTGSPDGWFVLPNLMYLGQRDGTGCSGRLVNISNLFGFGTIQKGHGIVFFDFNNDGRQDVYSSLGGMFPGDAWPNQFFVNHSHLENNWVKIRLRGRRTNYFGAGARMKVIAENPSGDEIVRYYHMDMKTGFGSSPYLAHIGLAEAVRIRSVEVFWPVSGYVLSYPAELNKLNILDEDEGQRTTRFTPEDRF